MGPIVVKLAFQLPETIIGWSVRRNARDVYFAAAAPALGRIDHG